MAKVDSVPRGTVIKETKFTEAIPGNENANGDESRSYDALDYMEKMKPEDWATVTAYVYRTDPPVWRGAGEKTQIAQYTDFFDMMGLQREYGGGVFRILLKNTRTKERLADSKHSVSGPPRDLTREQNGGNTQGGSNSTQGTDGGVISQAMSMAANPTAQAAQVDMLRGAANSAIEMVKANSAPQLSVKEILELAREMNGGTRNEKPFMETEVGKIVVAAAGALVTALVGKLVTPTDPLEQLSKYADLFSKMGSGNSTSDWKAALVQAAPQIANAVKDTVQEFRLGTEAQMRMNAGRTLTAAPPAPPAAVAPAAQQNPEQTNVVEMPPPAAQGAQPMEPFETKLIELLNDPKMTGDKAGEILDQTWPRFVDEIATYQVDMIIVAFRNRPLLQPYADHPRLRQFITEFLEWAREADAPSGSPAPTA